jgi:DNA-3-methyladenine glycosylase II
LPAGLLPFIQEFPADRLLRKADDGNFATLAKAIVFQVCAWWQQHGRAYFPPSTVPEAESCSTLQQLATGAAAAIYARVLQACDCTEVLTPEAVLAAPLPELRAAGLSERKASYIADLADYFSSGRLSDDKINAMDEAELEAALTAVRGIGLCEWPHFRRQSDKSPLPAAVLC